MVRVAATVSLLFALTGCALYSDVSVTPLRLIPSSIDRGSDIHSMIRKADYLRAIELASSIESRQRPTASELAALGDAYLAAGRFAQARAALRAALDLRPHPAMYADIAWDLSQVEFLANNFEASLEWAEIAKDRGLNIRQWHLAYLKSLIGVPVYRFSGAEEVRLPFRFGKPEVPRVEARVNGTHDVEAIVDSGAVLSIVSERFATSMNVRRLGDFEGPFYGLLGEPIAVRFGVIHTLELDRMVVEHVPVAIMPDDKMRFLVNKSEGREFHMDFLLGSNLLKEMRLELNFDRRTLTLRKLAERDRKPSAEQNLFFQGFRPHVRGAINRRGWYLFILDTGSEVTFLNESRLSSLPVKIFGSGGAHSATLQGLGGAMKRGTKLENVEIGFDEWAGTFRTIPMYSADETDHAVGIVGQNFLEQFNVVIDFGSMRVELARR
jgi:tetratricopeptide (TPR) repeat protein